MGWYRWVGDELYLTLQVQPRASRDELVGPMQNCYKVRITAPPVDGKANRHLLKYLARQFGVSGNQARLIGGEHSRRKIISLKNPTKLPIAIHVADAES